EVPGLPAPLPLVLTTEDVFSIGGSLDLDVLGFAKVKGSFGLEKETSTADDITTTKLLVGITGVDAVFEEATSVCVRISGGTMGLVLSQTGEADSTYALDVKGGATLLGVSGVTLSAGDVHFRKNTTGDVVDETITTPDGEVKVKFGEGEKNLTAVGGT